MIKIYMRAEVMLLCDVQTIIEEPTSDDTKRNEPKSIKFVYA